MAANDILAEELRANKAEVIGMLLIEYDEKKLRELFLAEGEAIGEKRGEKRGEAKGKLLDLAGLVYDGDLSMTVAENRAWQKYGVPKEDFRKMVEEYDPAEETTRAPVATKVPETTTVPTITKVPAAISKKGRA